MLADFLQHDVHMFLLAFARIGAAIMLLPGFGDFTVPARVRLAFALLVSLVLAPLVSPTVPTVPADFAALLLLLGGEVAVGLIIGTVARLLMAALQVAGTVISYNMGLGAAQLFDPSAEQQGAIASAFLTTLGVTLLFVTNLHHVMLEALARSYSVFVPGAGLPIGDFADHAARLVAESFRLGMQIALPLTLVGVVVYVAMGLMGRLMPQIQVFFVALPIQIVVGFAVLAASLALGMDVFLAAFAEGLVGFTGG